MPSDFKLPLPPPLRPPTDDNDSLYQPFSSSASFYTISSPSSSFSDPISAMSSTRSPNDVRHYPRYNLPSMIHQPNAGSPHYPINKYTPYPTAAPHQMTEMRTTVAKARWSRSSFSSSSNSPVPETMIPRSRQPHRKRQSSSSSASGPKECYSCHSTETPEWRRGPLGPRTLCNACGLIWAKLAKQNGKQNVAASSSQRNSWAPHDGVKLSSQGIPRSRNPCHAEPVPNRTPGTASEPNASNANKCAISFLLS